MTFSWSFSSMEMYENCARKYWAVRVAKKVKDDNYANRKGVDEHKVIEDYLRRGAPLVPQLQHLQPVLDKLLAAPGMRMIEKELCLNAKFEPCEYRDWNNGWLRMKLDFVLVNGDTAVYIDWKGGKVRPSDRQLKLAALAMFQDMPFVNTVRGSLLFVYYDKSHNFTLERKDSTAAWNEFLPTIGKMMESHANDSWPATPNPLCGWCPYKDCPHNTNRE